MSTAEYPAIAELVPHAEPMLALDRLVAWEPGRAECAMTVKADSHFVEAGQLSTVLTIEHMAQAVAACLGYEAFCGGEGVRVGMIVSCRSFRAVVPAIDVGEELRIAVERVRGNEALSHFECAVRAGGDRLIATATMTLVHDQPAAAGLAPPAAAPKTTPNTTPGAE